MSENYNVCPRCKGEKVAKVYLLTAGKKGEVMGRDEFVTCPECGGRGKI